MAAAAFAGLLSGGPGQESQVGLAVLRTYWTSSDLCKVASSPGTIINININRLILIISRLID